MTKTKTFILLLLLFFLPPIPSFGRSFDSLYYPTSDYFISISLHALFFLLPYISDPILLLSFASLPDSHPNFYFVSFFILPFLPPFKTNKNSFKELVPNDCLLFPQKPRSPPPLLSLWFLSFHFIHFPFGRILCPFPLQTIESNLLNSSQERERKSLTILFREKRGDISLPSEKVAFSQSETRKKERKRGVK